MRVEWPVHVLADLSVSCVAARVLAAPRGRARGHEARAARPNNGLLTSNPVEICCIAPFIADNDLAFGG